VRPILRTATLVKRTDGTSPSSTRVTTFVKFVWTGDRTGRFQVGSSAVRTEAAGTMVLTVYDLDGPLGTEAARFYTTVGSGARTGPYPAHRSSLAGPYDTVYERDLRLDAVEETLVEAEVTLADGTVQQAEAIRFGPASA
jgi:hypothetical protein